jgi:hypothetical protein
MKDNYGFQKSKPADQQSVDSARDRSLEFQRPGRRVR